MAFRPGLRAPRRRGIGGGVAVRAALDAGSAHHAVESIIRAAQPGLQLHLAEMGGHALNLMHSLAEGADAAVDAAAGMDVSDAAATVAGAAGDATQAAADAAANGSGGGAFEFLAVAFTEFLKIIDNGFELLSVPYSYGFSIIALTIIVKVATFPLTKQQVESSISMQALQPRIKEMQEKYKNDPERLQQETAALYQEAGVNPLAGCLPTLATIPVFIGLYRALLLAADEGLLKDGFFWIPSLAGPTSISARQAGLGLQWLLPFENGAPPIGWEDATAYLVLPVLLIISQYISQAIIQQKNEDPSQQGVQTLLKFLPLLLGWFSLNVPSGLTLYWITNNILSTGQQVYLKSNAASAQETKSYSSSTMPSSTTITRPPKDVIDVTPSGQEMGSRRSAKQIAAAAERKAQEGRSTGEKFRARKVKESAKKAATLAATRQEPLSPEKISVPDATSANAPPLDIGMKSAPLLDIGADVPSAQEAPALDAKVEVIAPNGGAADEETLSSTPTASGAEAGDEDNETVLKAEVEAGKVTQAAAVAAPGARKPGKRRKKKGKRKARGR
ncbi:unnamed protein product [Ostreobium quekettii]|uniref:Membrane insertase YidC/Oxa/ALB C-terminal domain-containing protein n=1 Tax=Ostreobium quekettii TaxID=121088 RepID=A0A8S1JI05_9CHLO|nr:unnamed protein product [Ostreobium quekettii]